MSVELLVANLLRVTAEDLEGARLLAGSGNRNAVYLCEQAAEKVIRAVVTTEGQHAGIRRTKRIPRGPSGDELHEAMTRTAIALASA